MKNFFYLTFLLLAIFFTPPVMAIFCPEIGGLTEEVLNETGKPLVASVYLHWQVWQVNVNSSNAVNGKFASKSIGGVSYYTGKDGTPGSMRGV